MLSFQYGVVVLLSVVILGYSEIGTEDSSCTESLASLDIASISISNAKNLYPKCKAVENVNDENDCGCGRREKSVEFLEAADKMISDARHHFITRNSTEIGLAQLEMAQKMISNARQQYPACNATDIIVPPEDLEEFPIDCTEVFKNGRRTNGVYTIWLMNRTSPLQVFCDMVTDGGGWTVIQRRGNFSKLEDFYRNWADYKEGFGQINQEFWIGNDNIYALSNLSRVGEWTIRFDLKDMGGVTKYAKYGKFSLEEEKSNYTLHLGGYSGNAGDCMWESNGFGFTTKDRKYLKAPPHCVEQRKSGWWFGSTCTNCNLNGINKLGVTSADGINWYQFRKWGSLSSIEIKIKRT